ncbi:MAG TPA: N-acetyltransferase [Actinophytocola sp.]|uniref:GNAT family N-acetyltransferase n=1 Tax=Actinophytocola sp. TaxID=1872138 RepID=UPI002DB79279|nr:N-acetyltransferase [Actinophytocola sp.]HEU5469768.1 N-acetyltransferase [Actinophytocola sp.]
MPVTIRTQRREELPTVREVVTDSFQDPVVGDLVVTLQNTSAGAAELFYVADLDGEIVGATMLTRSWLDAPQRLVEVLVLSPVAVHSAHQRQGVGSALIRHALTQAARTVFPLVFLEGNPAFYVRYGFQPAIPLGFTRPSVRIPDPAFQVVPLDGYEPWMTGAVVYADPFWLHDCVGLR